VAATQIHRSRSSNFDGHRHDAEPTIPNGPYEPSGSVNLLVLPTGPDTGCGWHTDIEIYTRISTSATTRMSTRTNGGGRPRSWGGHVLYIRGLNINYRE